VSPTDGFDSPAFRSCFIVVESTAASKLILIQSDSFWPRFLADAPNALRSERDTRTVIVLACLSATFSFGRPRFFPMPEV
jgi:hypothetical protein